MNRAMRRSAEHAQKKRKLPVGPVSLLFSKKLKDMLLAEAVAAMAFRNGFAVAYHFDLLWEGVLMMAHAADSKLRSSPDLDAIKVCEATYMALSNIRQRLDEKGRLGATGPEMTVLSLYAETAADFWPRQAGSVFLNALEAVSNWKRESVEKAKAVQ